MPASQLPGMVRPRSGSESAQLRPPVVSTLPSISSRPGPPLRISPVSIVRSHPSGVDTRTIGDALSPTQRGRSPTRSYEIPLARRTQSLAPAYDLSFAFESLQNGPEYPDSDFTKAEKHKQSGNAPEEVQTKQRVATAIATVLDIALDVIHDALKYGSEILSLAPVVGLPQAARALLKIWDSLRRVASIGEAGSEVNIKLQTAISRLVAAFDEVDRYLIKLSLLPFFMRYLQREKIQHTLDGCNTKLTDALSMFSVSIEINTLKQTLYFERQRLTEVPASGRKALQRLPLPAPSSSQDVATVTQSPSMDADYDVPASEVAELIRTQLQVVTTLQNEQDAEHDTQSLWRRIEAALNTNSDHDLIRILQIRDDEIPEAIETLQRAIKDKTKASASARRNAATETSIPVGSILSARSGSKSARAHTSTIGTESSRQPGDVRLRAWPDDTLESRFMATSIEAMRRLSSLEVKLPSWTITAFEVDMEVEIGVGHFSRVYKGTWRDRIVAIKLLVETTPQNAFKKEMEIWKKLKHPNVLELLGASSTQSRPPWFFVSPYFRNGSLVMYLKKLPSESMHPEGVLRMIHQIAMGMTYLHRNDVLHGDLKAVNVLVDDDGSCIISDFGQSEMKSEAYRQSGMHNPRGTLRWQAPEVLLGQDQLTRPIDVYAFAITCTEVLTKGGLPWAMQDDSAVRDLVIKENRRPHWNTPRKWSEDWSSKFSELLSMCWAHDPQARLSFKEIEDRLQVLHDSPPADNFSDDRSVVISDHDLDFDDPMDVLRSPPVPAPRSPASLRHEQTERSPITDTGSTLRDRLTAGQDINKSSVHGVAEEAARDERQYRTQLHHQFHPSLTLPLWMPSPIKIGAVGYHKEANGSFVTLFNAFDPGELSAGLTRGIPPMESIVLRQQAQGGRGVMQRMSDVFWRSWLSSWGSPSGATFLRRYSYPLRAGRDAACMFTESTVHRYIDATSITAPKEWFKTNVEQIVNIYRDENHITRKDLHLVIGTLEARDYALFVSSKHPDCQVNFDVFPTAWPGQSWGCFSFEQPHSVSGPAYDVAPAEKVQHGENISKSGSSGEMDAVLLSRLRFEDGATEPTTR
ncbi:hypothetical protein C2E23DRAFT_889200 [Lenzites betulinus]|nr:hypothetical protein C2E23DRAFT_889200 [Lenzites betulinus]